MWDLLRPPAEGGRCFSSPFFKALCAFLKKEEKEREVPSTFTFSIYGVWLVKNICTVAAVLACCVLKGRGRARIFFSIGGPCIILSGIR